MPFPLLIVWALGAMATGAAAGKGAQLVGDGKAEKASTIIKQTNDYVKNKHNLFVELNDNYLRRLQSFSTLIFSMTGEAGDCPNMEIDRFPEYLSSFWEKLNEPWSGGTGYKLNSEVWKLTPNEANIMRGVVTYGRGHPVAQSATWAFLYAQKGISYALSASASLEKIEAWARESRSGADAVLNKLQKQYDGLGKDWDIQIVPNLKKALGPPRNIELIKTFHAMGKLIEATAKARIAEAAAALDGESQ